MTIRQTIPILLLAVAATTLFAEPITIVNPSAEANSGAAPTGWTVLDGTPTAQTAASRPIAADDGLNLFVLYKPAAITQTLGSTYRVGTYRMSVDAAKRAGLAGGQTTGWGFGLYYYNGATLTEIAKTQGDATWANGTWQQVDLVLTVNTGAAYIGKAVVVKLFGASTSETSDFLDNVRLWGPSPTTLQHHYTFDTNAADSVGNVNGTFAGNAYVSTGGGNPVGGGSLALDGTGDWVTFGANTLTPAGSTVSNELTLSGWVRFDTNTVAVFYNESAGANTRYDFSGRADTNNGEIALDQYTASGGSYFSVTNTGFPDHQWRHVAYVQATNGTLRKLFTNGVQIATSGTPESYTGTTPTAVTIGARASGTALSGAIDDMAFWHEALTGDEMKCLYDVAANAVLDYDAGVFDQLKQLHDFATGSVTRGGLFWTRATGLTGAAGLSGSSPNYTLVLDATADTGLTSAQVGGSIIWFNPGESNVTATSAWAYVTLQNSNVDGSVLVWDTTDRGIGSTNDWPNRVSLGAWSSGAKVTGQMTNLLEKTLYNWRVYGFNATNNAWLTTRVFTTLDITPPTIQTLSPTNGAVNELLWANLVATFNETIVAGTGNIVITNLTDGTAMTIPVGDTQVTINGSTLTINPSSDLSLAKDYAVLINAGAVKDTSGNAFAGISAPATWSFTTFNLVTLPIVNPSAEANAGAAPTNWTVLTGTPTAQTAASRPIAADDGLNLFVFYQNAIGQTLTAKYQEGTYTMSVDAAKRADTLYNTGWGFGLYYDNGGSLTEVAKTQGIATWAGGTWQQVDLVLNVNPGAAYIGKAIVLKLFGNPTSGTSDFLDNVRLWGPKPPPAGTMIRIF